MDPHERAGTRKSSTRARDAKNLTDQGENASEHDEAGRPDERRGRWHPGTGEEAPLGGAALGAVVGEIAGAAVGGPPGAIAGGVAGAALGGAANVDDEPEKGSPGTAGRNGSGAGAREATDGAQTEARRDASRADTWRGPGIAASTTGHPSGGRRSRNSRR